MSAEQVDIAEVETPESISAEIDRIYAACPKAVRGQYDYKLTSLGLLSDNKSSAALEQLTRIHNTYNRKKVRARDAARVKAKILKDMKNAPEKVPLVAAPEPPVVVEPPVVEPPVVEAPPSIIQDEPAVEAPPESESDEEPEPTPQTTRHDDVRDIIRRYALQTPRAAPKKVFVGTQPVNAAASFF